MSFNLIIQTIILLYFLPFSFFSQRSLGILVRCKSHHHYYLILVSGSLFFFPFKYRLYKLLYAPCILFNFFKKQSINKYPLICGTVHTILDSEIMFYLALHTENISGSSGEQYPIDTCSIQFPVFSPEF